MMYDSIVTPRLQQQQHGPRRSYKRMLLYLLAVTLVVHLLLASLMQLGNDEAYYWLYTQKLQWNYFDHPPMVALWTRIFTLNNLIQAELALRFGSIAALLASTYFIYNTTALLANERAGWYAALLYNTSFYASMVAGLLLMPDSPQMFFWTLSLYTLVRVLNNERSWKWWIAAGLAMGAAIMSKVHGVFLPMGLLLFALLYKKNWLSSPQLYVSLVTAALVASPILLWNITYDFVTYSFHIKRVDVFHAPADIRTFIYEVTGQLFFNNPVNVLLTAIAIWRIRKAPAVLKLFACIGLPLIFILLAVSISKPLLPHWSGPAYVTLIPAAAICLSNRSTALIPRFCKWSIGAFLFFAIGWPIVTYSFPGTWGSIKPAQHYGYGDMSLDRFGWREAAKEFSTKIKPALQLEENTPVVCNTWWGAHVEYFFCRPNNFTMLGLGGPEEIHQYLWLNSERKYKVNIETAIAIVPSDEYYDPSKEFAPYYSTAQLLYTIHVKRNGVKARSFFIYRLAGYKGTTIPEWSNKAVVPTRQHSL